MITIKKYQDADLEKVLDVIRRSDSTDRTRDTWVKNNMTAVLAVDEEKCIGIIPFEKRSIVLVGGETFDVLWVSAAHVDPDYRSQGIGSQLDQAIGSFFSLKFKAIFVCRQDEGSAAFRWYRKNGYNILTKIISLKKKVTKQNIDFDYLINDTFEKVLLDESKIFDCFQKNIGLWGGFPIRDQKFWSKKIQFHYYQSSYRYVVIAIKGEDGFESYAFLGKTCMKDNISRIDILEIIFSPDLKSKRKLYLAVMDYASKQNAEEVRLQLAERDSELDYVKSFGFEQRWETNLIGKIIDQNFSLSEVKWRFFQIDYI